MSNSSMNSMKKKAVAAALTAGLLGGGAAGMIMGSTGVSGAQETTTTVEQQAGDTTDATGSDAGRPDPSERFATTLAPLVEAEPLLGPEAAALMRPGVPVQMRTPAGGAGPVPVAAQLDLMAFAVAVGAKRAVMAKPTDASRSSGYVVGGISPIAQRTALPTVLDETAQLFETIYVSAGKRGLQVELSPADLRAITGAGWGDIAGW